MNASYQLALTRKMTCLAALLLAVCSLQAQVPFIHAPAFDAAAVQADDQQRAQAGELPLYGRTLPIMAGSDNSGVWSIEGRERVWRLGISSPGALALECFLDRVNVPSGATLGISASDGSGLSEPRAIELPDDVHEFSTALEAGDACILEYREPVDAPQRGSFRVASVGHAYRDVWPVSAREGNCHVNVACEPESDGWEGPIDATVRISVVVSQGTGWCTGTLVNNVRQDCAPYILSAWHCGRTSTTAQFNQYKFYFNFQYATCSGGAYSMAQYMTGAQLKAYSDDYAPQYQGLGGSDFMLLRTNLSIPAAYDPYWAGWDATNLSTVTADGVCVHHPTGAPKRISSYTQTLTTGHPMASSGLMSHYKVIWAQTVHGWGITENGSSGAGLFKQIEGTGPVLIGTCTGNSSGMNCSNHTGTAYFGKMSYHWTGNPNAANIKLKAWLDPDNTGTLVLAGSDDPCAAPNAIPETAAALSPLLAPNPADEQIMLRLPAEFVFPAQARLVDALGRTAAKWTILPGDRSLDIRNLPAGAYTLTLPQAGKQTLSGRILIAH